MLACHAGLRKRTPAFARVPSLQDEINVLVVDSSGRLEEVSAQGDALTEVKLKLRLKGWFTSNSSLVSALLPMQPSATSAASCYMTCMHPSAGGADTVDMRCR